MLIKSYIILGDSLMRPVGQTPYAVAVGLQIRQQLDHARKRAGQRVRVVADVELGRLPVTNRRKVGTTSDHHAPYDLGYTRATMDGTTSRELARAS